MTVCHAPGLLTEVLDGEAVVLRCSDRRLHRLNAVATCVWLELAEPSDPTRVAELLAARFGAPLGQVSGDVLRLVADLREQQLLADA